MYHLQEQLPCLIIVVRFTIEHAVPTKHGEESLARKKGLHGWSTEYWNYETGELLRGFYQALYLPSEI